METLYRITYTSTWELYDNRKKITHHRQEYSVAKTAYTQYRGLKANNISWPGAATNIKIWKLQFTPQRIKVKELAK